ncbi:MAG: Ankyrin repeats (3 copies) [Parcubacteria group bacterium ADurb.Bin216]|nr:MAG: Ankyrin repeats (3 copies) [Parcubacteria group bacterium ADurb.Bin216]
MKKLLIILILITTPHIAHGQPAAYYHNNDNLKFLISNIIDKRQSKASKELLLAADTNNIKELKKSIKNNAFINTRNINGETPLIIASYKGNHIIVKELIKNGADVNKKDSRFGITPLSIAGMNGHSTIAEELIIAGADVNTQNIYGSSPLRISTKNGKSEIVKILINNGAHVDIKADDKTTPLMTAFFGLYSNPFLTSEYEKIIKYLIAAGSDVNAVDAEGDSVLIWASGKAQSEINKELKTANPSIKEDSPYQAIPAITKIKAIKFLIESGANLNFQNKGLNALDWSYKYDYDLFTYLKSIR